MANAQHNRPGEEVNLEIDDTQSARILGESDAHHTPILVLSRDAALVETVRKAAPRGSSATHAPDLDQVADRLPSLKPGVLVVDTASTSDVAALVAQLTQHFPELVVVVAGKREDSASLMQLTAAGRIFRFLLTPLSHGQTRLALEAAITQHADLSAASSRQSSGASGEGGSKNYVMTYGALAAGLLILIGAIWFGVKQFTGKEAPPVETQVAAPSATPSIPTKQDPVQAELALAKEAFDQGRFLEPAGESALDYYRSALALDPQSQAAKDGVRSVVDRILGRAEQALTAEKLEDAVRTIEQARSIDPTHPRLAFLDTQIARERERLKLTQARDVGNRVSTLVAQANDRMANGRLISPASSNARDALLEARRLDPTDPTVVQGMRELSSLLTEEARKSLAAGRLDEAQAYVNGARQLGSADAALAQVQRSITEANRPAATAAAATTAGAAAARRPGTTPAGPNTDGLVAEVRQRMNEGKLIDPAGASARDSLNQLIAQTPDRPEVEELSRALSTRLLNSSKQAMAAKAYDRSAQLLAGARDVGARYNGPAISQAEAELSAAREQSAAQTAVVSAASLKRTRTVNPVYPESARKRGVEGWVEMAFTVTTEGRVEDVEVRNSSPAEIFDDAATRAIRQWRFEPVERNGQKVPQRAMVRLRFEQQQ
ncbi:MAG TPA: energy transducer TonB [Povalibacter sp.]|uniref:energy transducer TonB n=1 Tax=Povalibacter sp. TaxID=1962978 RepID=UPI002C0E3BB9|nr:energy transducer TonB [Povalibacter sp.]HMN43534.1 energy transducer TonB [Povalibacter sp.]